jgi:hypothetical protein
MQPTTDTRTLLSAGERFCTWRLPSGEFAFCLVPCTVLTLVSSTLNNPEAEHLVLSILGIGTEEK